MSKRRKKNNDPKRYKAMKTKLIRKKKRVNSFSRSMIINNYATRRTCICVHANGKITAELLILLALTVTSEFDCYDYESTTFS